MFGFNLLPRQGKFFEDFISLASEIRKGSRLLRQMLMSNPPDMAQADAIKEIEHECDRCTRSILDQLNRTFVTPLDREDIHALAGSLDDVMDAIDAAAAVVRLYKIKHVRTGARRLADVVCESVDRVAEAVAALADGKPYSLKPPRMPGVGQGRRSPVDMGSGTSWGEVLQGR